MEKLKLAPRRGYFRIYSVKSENPTFDLQTWKLTVDGLVENPRTFTLDELHGMPWKAMIRDFHCVTGWSVTNVKWEGIPFAHFIPLVKPKLEGKHLVYEVRFSGINQLQSVRLPEKAKDGEWLQ